MIDTHCCEYRIFSGIEHSVPFFFVTNDQNQLPTYTLSSSSHSGIPPPYNYEYGVNDPHQGSIFSQKESRDNHNTAGEYRVNLPDGRVQIVSYTAGPNGYVADVKYEGKPTYPKHKPFAHPSPTNKPEPLPKTNLPYHGHHSIDIHKPALTYHPAPIYTYNPAPIPAYNPTLPYNSAPISSYKPDPAYKDTPYTPVQVGFFKQ